MNIEGMLVTAASLVIPLWLFIEGHIPGWAYVPVMIAIMAIGTFMITP